MSVDINRLTDLRLANIGGSISDNAARTISVFERPGRTSASKSSCMSLKSRNLILQSYGWEDALYKCDSPSLDQRLRNNTNGSCEIYSEDPLCIAVEYVQAIAPREYAVKRASAFNNPDENRPGIPSVFNGELQNWLSNRLGSTTTEAIAKSISYAVAQVTSGAPPTFLLANHRFEGLTELEKLRYATGDSTNIQLNVDDVNHWIRRMSYVVNEYADIIDFKRLAYLLVDCMALKRYRVNKSGYAMCDAGDSDIVGVPVDTYTDPLQVRSLVDFMTIGDIVAGRLPGRTNKVSRELALESALGNDKSYMFWRINRDYRNGTYIYYSDRVNRIEGIVPAFNTGALNDPSPEVVVAPPPYLALLMNIQNDEFKREAIARIIMNSTDVGCASFIYSLGSNYGPLMTVYNYADGAKYNVPTGRHVSESLSGVEGVPVVAIQL